MFSSKIMFSLGQTKLNVLFGNNFCYRVKLTSACLPNLLSLFILINHSRLGGDVERSLAAF